MFILIAHESWATTRGDTDRLCLHYFLGDPWAIPQKLSPFHFHSDYYIKTWVDHRPTGQTTLGDLQEGWRTPPKGCFIYLYASVATASLRVATRPYKSTGVTTVWRPDCYRLK